MSTFGMLLLILTVGLTFSAVATMATYYNGTRGATKRQAEPKARASSLKVPAKNPEDEASSSLRTRWHNANNRHQKLKEEYGAYLVDLEKVFRYPALSDVSEELTANFVEAFSILTSFEDKVEGSTFELKDYEDALSLAWKSWRLAENNAFKVGLDNFTLGERKKLNQASQLLKMALDPGAFEAERIQAYAQAQKLLQGLVRIPPPALRRIESSVRPALSAS